MVYIQNEHKCRLCNGDESGSLIKYGVRHYVHARCGLAHWGASFFDKLHLWQLENFPALPANEFGLYDELTRRIAQGRRNAQQ